MLIELSCPFLCQGFSITLSSFKLLYSLPISLSITVQLELLCIPEVGICLTTPSLEKLPLPFILHTAMEICSLEFTQSFIEELLCARWCSRHMCFQVNVCLYTFLNGWLP